MDNACGDKGSRKCLYTYWTKRKKESESRISDAGLLAVRFPYVLEEVGGREEDWDSVLLDHFQKEKIIGIICEVKTGRFNENDLFKEENIRKAFGRFGFVRDHNNASEEIISQGSFLTNDYEVKKILISRKREVQSEAYIHINLFQVRSFIRSRVRKYQDRKFGDRKFFSSALMQFIIWEEELKRNSRVNR